MRLIALLTLLASPAAAWEFSATSLCILEHSEPRTNMRLTYDPIDEIYSITVTRETPWPDGDVFGMRFEGQRPVFIQTDRHLKSPDGRSVTVVDEGFGNVLNGLQYNIVALAFVGGETSGVSLAGAAPEVAAFRACTEAGIA
ncbi:MAG: excinuclease ABC subunit B [Pseudomonadota bacterium]